MTLPLPPPLVVTRADHGAAPQPSVCVLPGGEADPVRAEAFGALLARSRASRGVLEDSVDILVAADPLTLPPDAPAGRSWVPHVFCWESPRQAALAWELCDDDKLEARLGATPEDVARWTRPALLMRLIEMAASLVRHVEQSHADEHLSFRWLLGHQQQVAELLSGAVVAVEHVSLHVVASEEDRVVEVLSGVLGLVEIPRPTSVTVPGRWLQAGSCRIHLNSRAERPNEEGFPGTAPNHVCFAVADLSSAEEGLNDAGFETRRAGSLGNQVWFRLPGGTAIELQSLRDNIRQPAR